MCHRLNASGAAICRPRAPACPPQPSPCLGLHSWRRRQLAGHSELSWFPRPNFRRLKFAGSEDTGISRPFSRKHARANTVRGGRWRLEERVWNESGGGESRMESGSGAKVCQTPLDAMFPCGRSLFCNWWVGSLHYPTHPQCIYTLYIFMCTLAKT